MTDYPYDPEVPYVVEVMGKMLARFVSRGHAEVFSERYATGRVIDTTPKPRVPEDATFITYFSPIIGRRLFAYRAMHGGWVDHDGDTHTSVETLPGVTPDTIFTVLDERKR